MGKELDILVEELDSFASLHTKATLKTSIRARDLNAINLLTAS